MFNFYQMLHGDKVAGVAQSKEAVQITMSNVWIDPTNPNGFLTKEEIRPYLENLTNNDLNHVGRLLDFIKSGARFKMPFRKKHDKGGNLYLWAGVIKSNAEDGVKIVFNEELVTLLDAYVEGRATINFDLKDIIKALI